MTANPNAAHYRSPLPEYAHPPIVAATLGVLFEPELTLNPSLLADFQQQLGPEWLGNWQPLAEQINPVPSDPGLISAGWELKNVLQDRVIRISPNHFAFIWLGTEDGRYPRYENLRDGFVAAWELWCARQPASANTQLKWSVSYLNRIPQGTVWLQPNDWSFFKLLAGISGSVTEQLTSAQWRYDIPRISEGLVVNWGIDASRAQSTTLNHWVRLTTAGKSNGEVSSLLDGMDAGRTAIVHTFSELMSPAANAYWGLRRRES